jgi:hypothetical protein
MDNGEACIALGVARAGIQLPTDRMKGLIMSDMQRQGRVGSPPVAMGFFRWPDAEFSNPMFSAFGSYPKMVMDCNAELLRFWNDRMNYDRETFRAIAQCAEWPKVIEMEQAWLRTTAEDYLNETKRLMKLNSDMAETIWGNAQQTESRAPVSTRSGQR